MRARGGSTTTWANMGIMAIVITMMGTLIPIAEGKSKPDRTVKKTGAAATPAGKRAQPTPPRRPFVAPVSREADMGAHSNGATHKSGAGATIGETKRATAAAGALGALGEGKHRPSEAADAMGTTGMTGVTGVMTDSTTKTAKTKVYTFGAMDVEGKLKTPQLLYFLNRVKLELEMSAPDRRSFMKELEKTAEDTNL